MSSIEIHLNDYFCIISFTIINFNLKLQGLLMILSYFYKFYSFAQYNIGISLLLIIFEFEGTSPHFSS